MTNVILTDEQCDEIARDLDGGMFAMLRGALRELVDCLDADPLLGPAHVTPGYRWHDAWQTARALAGDTPNGSAS